MQLEETGYLRKPGLLVYFSLQVQADVTDKGTLSLINAYNPGLSSAWMLQKAMSVRVGEEVDRDLINRMLASNFSSMAASGEDVMKPFLQVSHSPIVPLPPALFTESILFQ